MNFSGRYVDNRRERRADLSVELNGREVATLTAGLAAHSRQGRDVIRPIFTVTYQGQDAIRVTGRDVAAFLPVESNVTVTLYVPKIIIY